MQSACPHYFIDIISLKCLLGQNHSSIAHLPYCDHFSMLPFLHRFNNSDLVTMKHQSTALLTHESYSLSFMSEGELTP